MDKSIIRDNIKNLALKQIDKEYVHGGHGPNNYDCAGLAWYLYKEILDINIYQNGYGLSTTTQIMTSSYGKITLYEELDKYKDLSIIKTGDILFFHRQSYDDNKPQKNNKYPGHCGIYLEDNIFIHCSKTQKKVIVNYLNDYWYDILVGKKDIISDVKTKKIEL